MLGVIERHQPGQRPIENDFHVFASFIIEPSRGIAETSRWPSDNQLKHKPSCLVPLNHTATSRALASL
jgi:hypothetical protein